MKRDRLYWLALSIEARRLWVLNEPDPRDLAGKLVEIAHTCPAPSATEGAA